MLQPLDKHKGNAMKHLPTILSSLFVLCAGLARAEEPKPPFETTEERPRCAHYTATRQPFFGELHVHTQYSADAASLDTRNTPRDAYRYARGEKVGLPPFIDTRQVAASDTEPPVGGVSAHPYCLPPERCEFTATRTIQLPAGRALDFAAVTDHSEFLGETNICFFEGLPCRGDDDSSCEPGQVCRLGTCVPEGYDSPSCVVAREDVSRLRTGLAAVIFGAGVASEMPQRLPFCKDPVAGDDGTCVFQAKNVWQQTIAAAEAASDRTDQCRFTAFIGYEYTSTPVMNQCVKSFAPCFDDKDCGDGDTCAPRGQCSRPAGKLCFTNANGNSDGCDPGAECVADPGLNNLHRNIIFRNSNVPDVPISYIDVPTGCGAGRDCRTYQGAAAYPDFPRGTFSSQQATAEAPPAIALGSPTVMLKTLQQQCNSADPARPCDFISIPHNSNLSGGAMFLMPESPEDARVRGERERLVEILQIKGGSECRFSASHPQAWQPGAFAPDELCDFENMSFAKLNGAYLIDPEPRAIPSSSYVRNALKDGLRYRQQHPEEGVNPFQLGFVGGLDNHNGTPGASDEQQYAKSGAHGDLSFAAPGQMLNETFFLGLQTNGGSLTAAWAEENSRDSLFAAMKRRETYATSGTRPIVRFFGGFDLKADMCRRGDFAAQGYEHGVPMGATLPEDSGKSAPSFAISALMDPGWAENPGATLQRAQVIKGWVDAGGEVHERVYDVAGDGGRAVPVDLATCTPGGPGDGGLAELCTVWTDPDFDPRQHAFYYARIVENLSCRWNQRYCLERQVDCRRPPTTDANVGYNAYEYEQCCSDDVPKAVQQRAWTSPIWYVP
jgi:hypothetical protein